MSKFPTLDSVKSNLANLDQPNERIQNVFGGKKTSTFGQKSKFSNCCNFFNFWSQTKFLVPRGMYSSRSVDSRGLCLRRITLGYPYRVQKVTSEKWKWNSRFQKSSTFGDFLPQNCSILLIFWPKIQNFR